MSAATLPSPSADAERLAFWRNAYREAERERAHLADLLIWLYRDHRYRLPKRLARQIGEALSGYMPGADAAPEGMTR